MSELAQLYAQIRTCNLCILHKSRVKAVPGEGPEHPKIMFIGEGPGFHEDQQGRPFVGAAGQFLEELLKGIGLKREQVYITNVVKCFISPRVLIYTVEGYKPIKDIQVGDLVLTHTGRFRKVTYVRPRDRLPAGSPLVRLAISSPDGGKPVRMTVTPEHPFLVNGEWTPARDIRIGDRIATLGDRCEICGRAFFVQYDRYDVRVYRTCGPACHNKRIMHSPETREKIRQTMNRQYAEGLRDPIAITVRANERTRELVAAGEAKVQHLTAEERYRGRIALAERITAGRGKHPIGYGEEELRAILEQIEVEYIHHFALPGSAFTYDFCLPHEKILVEVRGPGFSNRAVQERALVKDRQAEDAGYIVLDMWWLEIVRHPEMVKSLLERLLKNHRDEYVFVEAVVTQVEHRQAGRDLPLYNIGVEDDESYIAAGVVSHNCRPPGNRDPLPDEIEACRAYLDRQIALLQPKVIVSLGRYSMARAFPNAKISQIHGQPRKIGGILYIPMYHPAAALHQPSLRRDVEHDFGQIPRWLAEADVIADTQAPPPEPPQQLSLF